MILISFSGHLESEEEPPLGWELWAGWLPPELPELPESPPQAARLRHQFFHRFFLLFMCFL